MHGRLDKSRRKRKGRVKRCMVEIEAEKERNKGERRGGVNLSS